MIGGRHNTVTLASHSEAIAATIPGAKLRIVEGVHLLNVERPAEFLGALNGLPAPLSGARSVEEP